jgi:hypothetical protein
MAGDSCIVNLSRQEMMRIEMIVMDSDKDDALIFIRELRAKIESSSKKGMKNHLDG